MTVAEDLAFMMADTSLTVPVIYGTVTGRGYLAVEDVFQTDTDGGQVLGGQVVLTVAAADFPTIADDTDITVDGTSRRIRTTRRTQDGKVLKVGLAS